MPSVVAPIVLPGSMADHAQPHLIAGELVLRPWTVADVPALVAAYDDPAIRRWHVRTLSRDEAERWVVDAARSWADERGASWAIATRAGELAGRVTLGSVDLARGSADVRYWVVAAARGRGVASRALRASTTWATSDLGLHRLELEHSTQNVASCRVAERAGQPDPTDGRFTLALLTRAGHEKVAAAAPAHHDLVERLVFDTLTRAQARQLGAISRRISAAVDSAPAWQPPQRLE